MQEDKQVGEYAYRRSDISKDNLAKGLLLRGNLADLRRIPTQMTKGAFLMLVNLLYFGNPTEKAEFILEM